MGERAIYVGLDPNNVDLRLSGLLNPVRDQEAGR
ncbi:hypothetical protein A2U01_0109480, partial [Trifolium medium]|nr:hypothetical protein [Trifolium medium]